MRNTAIGMIVAGFAVIAIGCGGGDSLNIEEYAAAFCGHGDWFDPDAEYETWGDVKSAMRDVRGRLDDLNPPDELAAYHRETRGSVTLFLDTLDEYDDDEPYSALEMLGSVFAVVLIAGSVIDEEEENLAPETRSALAAAGCNIDAPLIAMDPADTEPIDPPNQARFRLTCEWERDHANDTLNIQGTIGNENEYDIAAVVLTLRVSQPGSYLVMPFEIDVRGLGVGETREWETDQTFFGMDSTSKYEFERLRVESVFFVGAPNIAVGSPSTTTCVGQ